MKKNSKTTGTHKRGIEIGYALYSTAAFFFFQFDFFQFFGFSQALFG